MTNFDWLCRTELITGKEKLELLSKQHVLVVGMGGVGSFAAEFLVRAGIGAITIVDGDKVEASNRNRQLPALTTTEGMLKTEVMKDRLLAINPELKINSISEFLSPDATREIVHQDFDYIVDCIDSIMPKVNLISEAVLAGKRLVSSMGAGGKMDPTKIKINNISKTKNCRLAFIVRKRLKRLKIHKGFKAVYSTELPAEESMSLTDGSRYKKSYYGTISYIPAAFGGACASVVVRDIIDWKERK
jgi:tRNA A37 threonylcarbamoyladenosine dehydratase